MPRRLIIAGFVSLILALILVALWNVLDWPPPRLILKYGLPPAGGPTGRTMTIEGVEFVELMPGYFRMGSHFLCENGDLLGRVCALLHMPCGKQPKHDGNECPPHWVELPRGYWIARTEITNVQFERFHRSHDRSEYSMADQQPVVYVTALGARNYCKWLSMKSGLDVNLPSEAEWESACGAGIRAPNVRDLARWAWCPENSGGRVHEVGKLSPNEWGLYDLLGNVWEWCESVRSPNRYQGSSSVDVQFPEIVRGGACLYDAIFCRPSSRTIHFWRGASFHFIGFRPVIR